MTTQLEDAARAFVAFANDDSLGTDGDLMPDTMRLFVNLERALAALDEARNIESMQAEIVTLKTSLLKSNARADSNWLQAEMYVFLRDNLHRLIVTADLEAITRDPIVARIDVDMRRNPVNPMYTARAIENCMKRMATEGAK
jgi:hypothetical protein